MNETMATARTPKAKKEAGNRILKGIGSNASQFINDAYDYLIQHGASPFGAQQEDKVVCKTYMKPHGARNSLLLAAA